MNILIVGLGVIGSTYGYLFQSAGHKTEHLLRKDSKNNSIKTLDISMLDGRKSKKGEMVSDTYTITHSENNKCYDLIFVSVPEGGISDVLQTLRDKNISGPILLFCGIQQTHAQLIHMLYGYDYIIGYPVAGGNIQNNRLNCCVFDHVMMESRGGSQSKAYEKVISLFKSCNIKTEIPYDMVEWIWLHMAINAGVISVAGRYGDICNTSESAELVMNSSKLLSEAVYSIRETTKIIASCGVSLKNYSNELLPYKIPAGLAGVIMKKMFSSNQLTRKIMTLHNNLSDLLFVCNNLYELGKKNGVDAPIFYNNYSIVLNKIKNGAE